MDDNSSMEDNFHNCKIHGKIVDFDGEIDVFCCEICQNEWEEPHFLVNSGVFFTIK